MKKGILVSLLAMGSWLGGCGGGDDDNNNVATSSSVLPKTAASVGSNVGGSSLPEQRSLTLPDSVGRAVVVRWYQAGQGIVNFEGEDKDAVLFAEDGRAILVLTLVPELDPSNSWRQNLGITLKSLEGGEYLVEATADTSKDKFLPPTLAIQLTDDQANEIESKKGAVKVIYEGEDGQSKPVDGVEVVAEKLNNNKSSHWAVFRAGDIGKYSVHVNEAVDAAAGVDAALFELTQKVHECARANPDYGLRGVVKWLNRQNPPIVTSKEKVRAILEKSRLEAATNARDE